MKKKIKKIILLVGIFICLYVSFNWNKISLNAQIRGQCYSEYSGIFLLDKIYLDEKEKMIFITFKSDGFDDSQKEVALNLYNQITDILFGTKNKKFYEYELEIQFNGYSNKSYFVLKHVTYDKKNIKVWAYFNTISYVLKICPEVSELYVDVLNYVSLEEFDNFTNLKKIYCFEDSIGIDESNYIHDIFPDCKLEWKQ